MRYPLPYAFARTHQLLLEEDADQQTLWMHRGSHAGALSEVCRKYPNLLLKTLDTRELVQRISSAYAQGESSAAAVVSEVESDADLSQGAPVQPCAQRGDGLIHAESQLTELHGTLQTTQGRRPRIRQYVRCRGGWPRRVEPLPVEYPSAASQLHISA